MTRGGKKEVLEMLSMMNKAEQQKLLEKLKSLDSELAQFLEGKLISLTDIAALGPVQMSQFLREVSLDDLGLALKRESLQGMLDELQEKMSSNNYAQLLEAYNTKLISVDELDAALSRVLSTLKKFL